MNEQRFGRLVNVVTLILGVTALIFALQANNLSREANAIARVQAVPQIVILDVHPDFPRGFLVDSNDKTAQLYCPFILRVANLGGAATAIVKYSVTVTYSGHEEMIESQGQAQATNAITTYPGPVWFANWFLTEEGHARERGAIPADTSSHLIFPVRLDAFTASDLYARFWYKIRDIDSLSRISTDPREGFVPLEVSYTLKLASGETVASPKASCHYLKP